MHYTLTTLQHAAEPSDPMRLYIYDEHGFHNGGLWFERRPRFPGEEITTEAAKMLAEEAIADKREVRIVNGGDLLVFHNVNGVQVFPDDAASFWRKAFAC